MKIKKLSKSVVQKIAAGQVIERPASVIKELVENSLDAGSSHITIVIIDGGLTQIIVSDNGSGMEKHDLLRAPLPHTTSKISQAKDLVDIHSFGFRGEALSSISSVSQMTIQSRPKGKNGYEIVCFDGKIISDGPTATRFGTRITVESLFSTTPVRKKQIKSKGKEVSHILSLVNQYAIAHPEIEFKLVSNNKTLLNTPPENKQKRINRILGDDLSAKLIPFKLKTKHSVITGLLGKPQIAKRKSTQMLFVNNRPVSHVKLTKLIKKCFSSLIDPRTQPVYILDISTPHSLVDVNVDPQKTTVTFLHESALLKKVEKKLVKTLDAHNLSYRLEPLGARKGDMLTKKLILASTDTWDPRVPSLQKKSTVLFIGKTYALLSTHEGIVIIDPHAAHERILFNEYKDSFSKASEKTITQKKPAIVDFTTQEYNLFQKSKEKLSKKGFSFENFGERSIKITSLPEVFSDREVKDLMLELSESLEEGEYDIKTEETLARAACRSAVKKGDTLSEKEVKTLYSKLIKEKENYTCPHGRPTRLEITEKELDKLFKRT